MRYTRYEYRKHGKMKFIISVVMVVTVSIGSGLYISSLVFKNEETISNNNYSIKTGEENGVAQFKEIVALQCGYYSKKENADMSISAISSYCQPFIVEEDGNYRVIAGLYDDESGTEKIEELKRIGIDVAKVTIKVPVDTDEDKKIIQITEGFLQITKKLAESDVKSIKTLEFKEWAGNIIGSGQDSKTAKLNQIEKIINDLKDEVTKSNSTESVQNLYMLIKN